VVALADVIFEHRMYLPSAGLFISVSAAAFYVSRGRAVHMWAAIAVLITALSAAAYTRNAVWGEETTLWEDTVRKSPGKARVFYNLGVAYKGGGEIDRAIEHYRIALRLKPEYAEAHNGIGVLYASRGLTGKAKAHLRIALRLKPDFPKPHYNLGLIYLDEGLMEKAVWELEAALRIDAHYSKARRFLDYISGLKDGGSAAFHDTGM
jgi:tetratricopeptide (TPR) repeat protein